MAKPVLEPAAAKFLEALPSKFQGQVTRRIAALEINPHPRGADKMWGMHGSLKEEAYRIKQGPYRILYAIRAGTVVVLVVDDRKDVYKR